MLRIDPHRLIAAWFEAWRRELVVVPSPLPVPLALERMAAGTVSRTRASLSFGAGFSSGAGATVVAGRVSEHGIRLEARANAISNSWRPQLRGGLQETAEGSRFVGELGWHPAVRAFSAVWLGLASTVFAILVIRAAVLTVLGRVAAGDLLLCLAALGFIAAFVLITGLGIALGRGEGPYLRSWLADRLAR